MTQPLRVRRLTDEEGRQIQRIVRRGGGGTDKSIVKWRRALVVQASAGGNTVPVIARLSRIGFLGGSITCCGVWQIHTRGGRQRVREGAG